MSLACATKNQKTRGLISCAQHITSIDTESRREIASRHSSDSDSEFVSGGAPPAWLAAIDRVPDFLVYLDGEGSHNLSDRLAAYRARHQPEQRADVGMQGFAE